MSKKEDEKLQQELEDEKERMIWVGYAALERMGEKAVPLIIQALEDEDEEVRWWAALALGRIGDKTAIEPIKEALQEDRNQNRRFYFAFALAKLEGKDGEGVRVILEMKENGKLTKFEIDEFNAWFADNE